jgi:hypothetical protein
MAHDTILVLAGAGGVLARFDGARNILVTVLAIILAAIGYPVAFIFGLHRGRLEYRRWLRVMGGLAPWMIEFLKKDGYFVMRRGAGGRFEAL